MPLLSSFLLCLLVNRLGLFFGCLGFLLRGCFLPLGQPLCDPLWGGLLKQSMPVRHSQEEQSQHMLARKLATGATTLVAQVAQVNLDLINGATLALAPEG